MLIASKYEDIYPPTLRDMEYITDKGYNKAEILNMEQQILVALDFNMHFHSAYRFLERYSKIMGFDKTQFLFGQFMLELGMLDYNMLKYKPSVQAGAAIYLTSKVWRL